MDNLVSAVLVICPSAIAKGKSIRRGEREHGTRDDQAHQER